MDQADVVPVYEELGCFGDDTGTRALTLAQAPACDTMSAEVQCSSQWNFFLLFSMSWELFHCVMFVACTLVCTVRSVCLCYVIVFAPGRARGAVL